MTERLFHMQNGPAIPWSLAERIYEVYSKLYGTQQSLQRLHDRGGFGWREVPTLLEELRKRNPPAHRAWLEAEQARRRASA